MSTSIVKVYNARYGKWEKDAKVVLGWNGWINLGMSKPVYSNADGIALVEHSATGEAEIFVNGTMANKKDTQVSTQIEKG
jgi:hypothetical protein